MLLVVGFYGWVKNDCMCLLKVGRGSDFMGASVGLGVPEKCYRVMLP